MIFSFYGVVRETPAVFSLAKAMLSASAAKANASVCGMMTDYAESVNVSVYRIANVSVYRIANVFVSPIAIGFADALKAIDFVARVSANDLVVLASVSAF